MRWLLLTRPAGRGAELDLSGLSMDCVCHPLISTESLPLSASLREQLTLAASLPRRVFVSVAAVEAIAALAPSQLQLPAAAVGERTAGRLREHGCESVWCHPQVPGIAGLFALTQWESVSGHQVALFCAAGGQLPDRDRLDHLQLRLLPVHVYGRKALSPSAALLRRLRADWTSAVFSATSVALLEQLDALLDQAAVGAARTRPLLVVSSRIAARAVELGYGRVLQVSHLDAEQIQAALAV